MVLNAKESFPWLQDALPTGGTSNVQQCFLHYQSQNLSITQVTQPPKMRENPWLLLFSVAQHILHHVSCLFKGKFIMLR